MGKKKRHSFMKDWSEDGSDTVDYWELTNPLRNIIREGYKIERKPVMSFHYDGYNIGCKERFSSPTPEERFAFRWLNNEAKFGRSLIDNVLLTAVQLGIEQGRRLERDITISNQMLKSIIEAKIIKIKNLEQQLSKFDSSFNDDRSFPTTTNNCEDFIIDSFDNEQEEESALLVK